MSDRELDHSPLVQTDGRSMNAQGETSMIKLRKTPALIALAGVLALGA
jgi:hypothetical protein